VRKHNIKIILVFVVLLTVFIAGCQSLPSDNAHREAYKIEPPVWSEWVAGDEYADYANLLALFSDRTKFATIAVPLDYANPSAGTLDVAVLKVEAKNPSERWGSILFNPGGPGGDGLIYGLLFNYLWSKDNPNAASGSGALFQELTEHYDLVGFSPRGLGASTKLVCSSDTDLVPELIFSADRSETNLAANMQNARAIAEALSANPLTQYINTEATARDMDVIRQVLGDEKLNFLGISYGTWLGTWYASLFPDRIGKMLFIGETDITGTWNEALLLQEMGMQRVLEKMLVPYAAGNPDIFHLGNTEREVMDALSSLQGELKHVTIKALDKHISYQENAHLALFTLRAALMIDSFLAKEQAPNIESLNQLLDKVDWNVHPKYRELLSETARTLVQDYFDLVNRKPEPVNLVDSEAVWWAVQCMDTNNAYDADSWALQSSLHSKYYPQFGGFYINNPSLFGSKAPVNRPPVENIPSDASIFIVQSEFDPYTPLEGALRTFSALPQASMIVLKGDYQHCIIVPYGNDELDRSVAEFFLNRKLPPRLSIVEGNPLPRLPETLTQ
jgi:pimeloyl-ACP methyl ester carboxylesterase